MGGPWDGVESDRRFTLADASAIALILGTILWFGACDIAVGGLDWSDAPLHAMDGVFLLEFARALPIDDPRGWAEQFYLRHPCLGILVYYPPGFAVIEAGIFTLFGVSVVTARATVLAFTGGAGVLMYVLGRRWFGRAAGVFAALLLLTCPHGIAWMRDIMLEWPATFWVLAALYAYQRDRERPTAWRAIATYVCVTAAFFTKQTAGFILPVMIVHALCSAGRRQYFARASLALGLAASLALIAAYSKFAGRYSALASQLVTLRPDFGYYAQHMPEIAGWPFMAVTSMGVFALFVGQRGAGRYLGHRSLILLAAGAWIAFSSLIAAKEPRYFFFALPPMALAAGAILFRNHNPDGRPEPLTSFAIIRYAIAITAIAIPALAALRSPPPRLPDYAPAVAALAERRNADLVLIDAVRDGQFVFDAWCDARTRNRIIPLRASKLFYARAARERFGYEQFVHSESDIVAKLDEYGIRYIVIESALPHTPYTEADPPPRQMLRRLLTSDTRFRPLQSWPLRCGDPAWDAVELRLYEYMGCPVRQADEITFSFPGMGGQVRLKFPALRASSQ